MRFVKLAIVAMIVALAATPTWAQPRKKEAATAFAEGQRQFKAKDYAKAAVWFKAAWAADEDPVYLFNIAQALRLAKQCAESRDYYKKFIAAAGVNIPNRDKVEKWLAEVEACAAKVVDPRVEDPTESPKKDPKEDPADPSDAKPARTEKPKPDFPDPGRGRRRAGIASIALGAVAVGVGVVFAGRVGSIESEREALCPDPCTWDDTLALQETDLERRGNQASKLAIASFAVGGAAIVSGVMLYVTGRSSAKERVAVTPVPGGAVARVGFSF